MISDFCRGSNCSCNCSCGRCKMAAFGIPVIRIVLRLTGGALLDVFHSIFLLGGVFHTLAQMCAGDSSVRTFNLWAIFLTTVHTNVHRPFFLIGKELLF